MKDQPKEIWIEIQGWDLNTSGRITGIAVDPIDPNVDFWPADDFAAVPAVHMQREHGVDVAMEDITIAYESLGLS